MCLHKMLALEEETLSLSKRERENESQRDRERERERERAHVSMHTIENESQKTERAGGTAA